MKIYLKIEVLFLISISILSLLLFSCSFSPVEDKRILLGTTVEIKAVGRDKKDIQQKINLAFNEVERLEKIFNFHNSQSELFRVNENAARQPVEVSKELFFVVQETIKFSKITSGAFDPTINSINRNVSYENIILNEKKKTIFFSKMGLKIDLGGCAKGYIVDQAAKKLKELGVSSFLINAGGDIIAIGKEWRIAIQHPKMENKILHVLRLKNKAIATSGNYLRPHIIIPNRKSKFGESAKVQLALKNSILSCSIISDSCFKSDILATAVFVLGKDKGLKLIETIKAVEGMLVIGQEKEGIDIIQSSGFNF